MFIEIKGIGLPNRGAELMLIGVMDEVKSKFVMMPETSYSERENTRFIRSQFYYLEELILDA